MAIGTNCDAGARRVEATVSGSQTGCPATRPLRCAWCELRPQLKPRLPPPLELLLRPPPELDEPPKPPPPDQPPPPPLFFECSPMAAMASPIISNIDSLPALSLLKTLSLAPCMSLHCEASQPQLGTVGDHLVRPVLPPPRLRVSYSPHDRPDPNVPDGREDDVEGREVEAAAPADDTNGAFIALNHR